MKIKIGDRVRFLNEVGGGKVIRVMDRNMAEIETDDGWAIPYVISELVIIPSNPDEAPAKAEVSTTMKMSAPSDSISDTSAVSVYLITVQEKDARGEFGGLRWFLVNDSSLLLTFAFYSYGDTGSQVVATDQLDPGTKMELESFNLGELSMVKKFELQGILHHSHASTVPPILWKTIPFSIKKFASPGSYRENDYLHEDGIVFDVQYREPEYSLGPVLDKDPENQKINRPRKFRSGKPNLPRREVDLHINVLVDSVVGLSNREIIKVQMDTFEKELNRAITGAEKEIVFIHGIGNGTLKETLRKTIEKDFPICTHEDASFKDYGFGATLVCIRQNK